MFSGIKNFVGRQVWEAEDVEIQNVVVFVIFHAIWCYIQCFSYRLLCVSASIRDVFLINLKYDPIQKACGRGRGWDRPWKKRMIYAGKCPDICRKTPGYFMINAEVFRIECFGVCFRAWFRGVFSLVCLSEWCFCKYRKDMLWCILWLKYRFFVELLDANVDNTGLCCLSGNRWCVVGGFFPDRPCLGRG